MGNRPLRRLSLYIHMWVENMNEKMKNNKVKGFLDVKDGKLVNGDGEEIILSGWGLGNWMLCEGYMWLSKSNRFDRPRRIEAVVEEVAGKDYAAKFWPRFRENYITEADMRRMSEIGYNSVRIPLNSRLFMEEGEGITWVDEGFNLLDKCLDWCEKYKLYAFIDLHGAPGGQTGANIDDSIDDVPRLFLDQSNFDKGIALWKKIAERYKDRWIVGGYDLLNEPIRPSYSEKQKNFDYLVPRLIEFYEKTTAAIREVDDKHVLSIEGHHWSTENNVFCKKYDDKMILHFHRYGVVPDKSSLEKYIKTAQRWNIPLWLGETGENMPEWFAALYPLCEQLGIGYNVWPWKKMDNKNSPCSVKKPEGWDELLAYTEGGAHPGYARAREILDSYLENMKFENCEYNEIVNASVLRRPGCNIKAVDYDEFPGIGKSFSGIRTEENSYEYRLGTFMKIVDVGEKPERRFGFDCGWHRFALEMEAGEFADYSLNDIQADSSVQMRYKALDNAKIRVFQDVEMIKELELPKTEGYTVTGEIGLSESEKSAIRIEVIEGVVELSDLYTR